MKKGFTLIELLVVVLIIGILSAIAVPQYIKVMSQTRLRVAMAFALSIKKAMDMQYELHGKFPDVDCENTKWNPVPKCEKPVLDYPTDSGDVSWYESSSEKYARFELYNKTKYLVAVTESYNTGLHYIQMYIVVRGGSKADALAGVYAVKYGIYNNGTTTCKEVSNGPKLCSYLEPVLRDMSPWKIDTYNIYE